MSQVLLLSSWFPLCWRSQVLLSSVSSDSVLLTNVKPCQQETQLQVQIVELLTLCFVLFQFSPQSESQVKHLNEYASTKQM